MRAALMSLAASLDAPGHGERDGAGKDAGAAVDADADAGMPVMRLQWGIALRQGACVLPEVPARGCDDDEAALAFGEGLLRCESRVAVMQQRVRDHVDGGRLDDAVATCLVAYTCARRTFGDYDDCTMHTRALLANVFTMRGEFTDTLRALWDVCSVIAGMGHGGGRALRAWSGLYAHLLCNAVMGMTDGMEPEDARAALREAVADEPRLLSTLAAMARLVWEFETDQELQREAREAVGADGMYTSGMLASMSSGALRGHRTLCAGAVECVREDWRQASRLLETSVAHLERAVATGDPSMRDTWDAYLRRARRGLAEALTRAAMEPAVTRTPRAEAYLVRARALYVELYGAFHNRVAATTVMYGQWLERRGNHDAALRMYRCVVAVRERQLAGVAADGGDVDAARVRLRWARYDLARGLCQAGDLAGAREALCVARALMPSPEKLRAHAKAKPDLWAEMRRMVAYTLHVLRAAGVDVTLTQPVDGGALVPEDDASGDECDD